MTENKSDSRDDPGPLIRRGYAVPPPGEAFVESLGSRLAGELRSQHASAQQPPAPSGRGERRRGFAAFLARHWRLGAELAACLAAGAVIAALATQRPNAQPPAAAHRAATGGHRRSGPPSQPVRHALVDNGRREQGYSMAAATETARRPGAPEWAAKAALFIAGRKTTGKPISPPSPPTTFRPVVPDHLPRGGLVALWLADDNAFDSAGRHHGAPTGVAYAADRHGKASSAFLFKGDRGIVAIPDHSELDTDDAFTVSVWIKPTVHGDRDGKEGHIVSKWCYSHWHNGDYILELRRNGHLALWVAHREQQHVQEALQSKSIVPTDRWTHVAATFDRGKMKVYVNGGLDAEKLAANIRHTSRREYDHDDVCIGSKWDGDFNFNGAVDEVAIWNRALSAAEIAGVHDGTPGEVPHLTRLARADRVALAGGSLLGTIRNKRYTLTTSFGRLEIPAARVVGLAPAGKSRGRAGSPQTRPGAEGGPIHLVLTDGQVLVGKLAEQHVLLKLSTGSILRIPTGAVRECSYRISDARPAAGPAAAAMAILRSGERLIFDSAKPGLQLLPAGARKTVDLPAGSLAAVSAADANGRTHRVRFVNGSILSGKLLPEKLTMKLRLGGEVTVGWRELRCLCWPARPVEPTGAATLLLRNGDRLFGKLTGEELTVATRFGSVELPAACILKMTFDANSPGVVAAEQWDGVSLRGRLAGPALTFSIAPGGPTIALTTTQIASITRPVALPPPKMLKRIQTLIGQLGAESHKDRQAATEALVEMGPSIIPLLRKHRSSDPEVRQRVQSILERLESSAGEGAGDGKAGSPPPPVEPALLFGTGSLPRDGLVALWSGDGNAKDSVGSSHGRPGSTTYAADRHGRAASAFLFRGKAAAVTVPDNDKLDTDDSFTLSLWLRPALVRRHRHILAKWLTSAQHADYSLILLPDNRLNFNVCNSDKGFVHEALNSSSAIRQEAWTHVAATFARGRMRVYVNGKLDAERTSTRVKHTDRQEYQHDDLIIGGFWTGEDPFHGALDEVGIWNRALSEEEIAGICGALPTAYVPRVAAGDRILLDDGRVLLGAIAKDRYRVATAFGTFDIPAGRVVGWTSPDEPEPRRGDRTSAAHLILTDGQVLVGKLAEQHVLLKLSTGSALRIPAGTIRECGYRLSDARPAVGLPAAPTAILRSGERLIFDSAKPDLQLLPAGARKTVDLPAGSLAAVSAADANGRTHRVRFVNGSILSGKLLPEKLTLKLRLGGETTIGRDALHGLLWPTRPVEPTGAATLLLRNGDRLLGRLTEEKLTIRTGFGDANVALRSLLKMTFDANSPGVVAAEQWDGVILRGRLAEPVLTFSIAPGGPTIALPPARIASITRSVALPPPEVLKRIQTLIGQLGAESHKDRQAATEALVEMGPSIIPLLRKHRSSDPEVRQRIQSILERLEPPTGEGSQRGTGQQPPNTGMRRLPKGPAQLRPL